MNDPDATRAAYEALPYQSGAFPATDPQCIAAMAHLFSVAAPDPNTARVLEIGCGLGENLIPIALRLPKSECVGIDLSASQIESARVLCEASGADNVRLEPLNLWDLDASWGSFDYIIAYGVYSWVDPETQKALFERIRTLLSPRGVALVSYNALPGWHMRSSVRDLMMMHTESIDDPREKVAEARAILDFLGRVTKDSDSPWARMLQTEQVTLDKASDSYVFHDLLEPNNTPVSVSEFVKQAGACGLQYLGEAKLSAMLPRHLPGHVQRELGRLSHDIVRLQQYLDFAGNRMFRSSLLVRDEVAINHQPRASALEGLWLAGEFAEVDGQIETPRGRLNFNDPQLRKAVLQIGARWPDGVPRIRLPASMGGSLLELLSLGLLELRTEAVRREPPKNPTVWPYASAQLEREGKVITGRTLRNFGPSDLERAVARLCDGTRDLEALTVDLTAFLEANEMTLHRDGDSMPNTPAAVSEALQSALRRLRRAGILW